MAAAFSHKAGCSRAPPIEKSLKPVLGGSEPATPTGLEVGHEPERGMDQAVG